MYIKSAKFRLIQLGQIDYHRRIVIGRSSKNPVANSKIRHFKTLLSGEHLIDRPSEKWLSVPQYAGLRKYDPDKVSFLLHLFIKKWSTQV